MRLLVVALVSFAWAGPVAQALAAGSPARHAHAFHADHPDARIAPSGVPDASFALTQSRVGELPEPVRSNVGVVCASTTVPASARAVLAAPVVASRAMHWILRHATTSAIP